MTLIVTVFVKLFNVKIPHQISLLEFCSSRCEHTREVTARTGRYETGD